MIRALGPAAIVAAAVAVPLAYVPTADSAFADPKQALLLIASGLGLAGWLLAWARGERQPGSGPLRVAGGAFVATTLLAAGIAAARRPPGAPYAAAELVHQLAIVGAAAAAAQAARDPGWRRRLFEAITVAAGLVSLIGLLQHLQLLPFAMPIISVPGSTFGNRNMAGEAIALALPFGFARLASQGAAWRAGQGDGAAASPGLRRHRFTVALLLAPLLAEVLFLAATRARGAWLGGLAGIVAFVAVRRPALSRRAALLLAPVVAGVLAAVLLPGRWQARDAHDIKRYESGTRVVMDAVDPGSPVVRTRLGLWRRSLAIYREHPLTGVGPGNFSVLFPLHAEPGAAADRVMSATMVARRPHNELVERLTETGPLGAVAFAGLFATALVVARARARSAGARAEEPLNGTISDRDAAAAGAGVVAACLGCGLTAFPLSMPATALLFGAALGVLDALSAAPSTEARRARGAADRRVSARWAAAGGLAAALVVTAGWLSYGVFASAYWRGRARTAIALGTDRAPDLPAALAALERAERAPRFDYVRFDSALRAAEVAVRLDRGVDAEHAADRALALEPYSPHALAARAAAELSLGREGRAAEDARQALGLFFDLPSARTTLESVHLIEAKRQELERRARDAQERGALPY